ncbi:AAA family ATPase [Pseudomonas aeruginosa]|uniref:AAA family ATPase n=1 Tax=Pseudomonas aeruginosa TaxID=287 RepID=UPI002237440C|nr:AAA family ATPase [Pseudomonas aeruginosa]MCW4649625.1 AAA family ATPase [Pseudomonas aeruginosa]
MSKLESITLSNIRKFGPEATIELSPGATILLAPNGTGKTTVFEAIEFGLTGKIARLGDDLSPIIRDNETQASVRLDFADLTAFSQVTAGGEVRQEGDLSSIFPETSAGDLPFLLRLTHLLDQREREWIVQAEEKTAGSQLARLPIGRDGSQASTTLPAVRRSLTEQKSREESSLVKLEADLNDWNRLIQERDAAVAGSTGALRPREQIAGAISDAAAKTQSLAQLPPDLLTEPVSQDSLAIVHSSLSEILQTKTDRLRAQILALAELDVLIARFTTAQSQSEVLARVLASTNDAFNAKSDERARNVFALSALQANILLAKQQRTVIAQQLELLVNEASARLQIEQRSVALSEATTTLAKAEDDCRRLRDQHESQQQLRRQHELINTQLQSLAQSEAKWQTGQQLVAQWQETLQRIDETVTEMRLAQEHLESLGNQLNDAMSTRTACEFSEIQARNHYHALSSTADAMRQAVASIAAHLPPDRGDCPVCGEEHGATELHARLNRALQAIDPNLTESERQLRIATDELVASQAAVSAVQTAVQTSQEQLAELEAKRLNLELRIAEFRADPNLASDSVSLARESVRRQLEEIASARQALIERQSALAAPATQDLFEQTQHAYDSAVRVLDAARLSQNEATTRLEQAVASLASITAEGAPVRSLDDLTAERTQIDQLIAEMNGKVETGQAALDDQQRQLSELTNSVQEVEAQIAQVQSQLATLRATWQELALPGDPLAEAAQTRGATLRASLANLERHVQTLEDIGVEISAWAKLDETHLAQRLIDSRRLDLSEEDFSAQLESRITEARTTVERLSQLSEAMETLDKVLKQEIGNVQKHVVKVVPRWRALLKRIVRDPRFSETSLQFYSSYNKERAGVSVPLSGKTVSVPAVASEAQLTDLQLTFLLSMAMSHQWSPWKALLLDDPTQHHDLVHASAVFDVLRDYIVDHGFQVVIATHDALQARYFLRKLQNDGIDAKIWTLVPTVQGVTAEEGHWKRGIR